MWRTGPFPNLSQTSGKPISLEKVAQPFDVNYMLKTHGSGGYRFDVCYSQPNGTEKKRIRQAYETIINMRYPPRVPAGEWLDNPRNKEWAWCKPELEAAEKHRVLEAAAKLNGTAEPQQSKTEELSDMLDLVNKLKPAEGNANTALLLELIKMNDPSKAFTLAKEIAGMAAPAPQNQDNSITAMLLKFLMEDRRALMDQRANAPILWSRQRSSSREQRASLKEWVWGSEGRLEILESPTWRRPSSPQSAISSAKPWTSSGLTSHKCWA